jgi:hypothetical protein
MEYQDQYAIHSNRPERRQRPAAAESLAAGRLTFHRRKQLHVSLHPTNCTRLVEFHEPEIRPVVRVPASMLSVVCQ